ncbi:hypothetical protein VTN00DRAFT_10234 [Thermoascus crustaceus]|uniref:uncharacterized protein n=1 Tax=Thermoascus crustaceus TaxID=5088 RepID=UPI00374348F4
MAAPPPRNDGRIIIHFDYDCFYASVFEAENPVLKSLPLAVQQKQIVVTANYEGRRRGLRKLQLISEAKKVCPDAVILLGEDLTKFRDASKALYSFLKSFVWGDRVEKLGFDEVYLDVTEMIEYNVELLNSHNLANSFFYLNKLDPTIGFAYDATTFCGPTYPPSPDGQPEATITPSSSSSDALRVRLLVASHLAHYLRDQLEQQKGYTATVGVSTSKLLSKLAGSVHKPNNQTTLLPPYTAGQPGEESNVTRFLDAHDIGKVPGIGFKLAQKLRAHVLGREPNSETYHAATPGDKVTVRQVRLFPGMGPPLLDKILGGPGSPRDIGVKVWGLLNGVDSSEVSQARATPTQISIEDSYGRLDSIDAVRKELVTLAGSLIRRMRTDLTEEEEEDTKDSIPADERKESRSVSRIRWLARPRTLRLSTRPRPPANPDGSRSHSSNRISRSAPIPPFIFNLGDSVDALAERLVQHSLMSMFRKLHPEKSGWNLRLLNVAVTNMVESAGEQKQSSGRDIEKMFRKQEAVLRDWKSSSESEPAPSQLDFHHYQSSHEPRSGLSSKLAAQTPLSYESPAEDYQTAGSTLCELAQDDDDVWEEISDDAGEEEAILSDTCKLCGASIPHFAMEAHELYHRVPD